MKTPRGECWRIAAAISSAGPMTAQGVENPCRKCSAEPLEELDVLRLLLGEVEERPPLVTVPAYPVAHVVDDRGNDVLLHQTEDGQIGESPDLVERQLLLGAQTANCAHAREGLREEGPGEVQRPSLDDLLELPVDLLRRLPD